MVEENARDNHGAVSTGWQQSSLSNSGLFPYSSFFGTGDEQLKISQK
jgi:hypothetical protein